MGDLAAKRDDAKPDKDVATATQALVATVPTETLAAYTAIVAAVLAAEINSGEYGPFRLSVFLVFVVGSFLAPLAVYWGKHKAAGSRSADYRWGGVPWLECGIAAFAAAAWGLVMPGSPLNLWFAGNALTFATVAITFGAAAVLAFATNFLCTGTPEEAATQGAAAAQGAPAAQGIPPRRGP